MEGWLKKLKKQSYDLQALCDVLEEIRKETDVEAKAEKLSVLSENIKDFDEVTALEILECALHLAPFNAKVIHALSVFDFSELPSNNEEFDSKLTRSVDSKKQDKTQVMVVRKTIAVQKEPARHPIFNKLFDKMHLRDEILTTSLEFSNSLEGAVHFLNYLYSSSKVDIAELQEGASVLFEEISNDVTEIRARARYHELIESILEKFDLKNSA